MKGLLKQNARLNLIRTLEDWSNEERQAEYKRAVPFVHVPEELLCQWNQYARLLREKQDWFLQSLNEKELAALKTFDVLVSRFSFQGALPDVPEIFNQPQWTELMRGAGQLRILFVG